jgi:hypothetical protein
VWSGTVLAGWSGTILTNDPHISVKPCDKFLLMKCGENGINSGSKQLRNNLFPHLLVE